MVTISASAYGAGTIQELYQQLIAHHDQPGFQIQQACKLLEKGDAARAALVLKGLSLKDGDIDSASLLLAQACLQRGGTAGEREAVSVCRAALAKASTVDAQQEMRCALAVALGQLSRSVELPERQRQRCRAEAVGLLQRSASLVPKALTCYNLALLLAESGNTDAAVQHARIALQHATAAITATPAPNEVPAAGGTAAGELQTLSLLLVALLLSARGQLSSAMGVLATARAPPTLSMLPAAGPLQVSEFHAARISAWLQAAQGDLPGAISTLAAFKKRLQRLRALASAAGQTEQLNDFGAQAWLDLGMAFANHGGHDDALFCVDQGLRWWPWRVQSHHALGVCHAAAGNLPAAVAALETALALSSTHAPSLLALGTVLRRRGGAADIAQAQELLRDALRYEPNDPEGWHQLGLAAQAQGLHLAAEGHLLTAVKLTTTTPVLPYSTLPLLLL